MSDKRVVALLVAVAVGVVICVVVYNMAGSSWAWVSSAATVSEMLGVWVIVGLLYASLKKGDN
jgi:hypothetical protein